MLPERAAREAIPVVPSELLELSGNASLELDSGKAALLNTIFPTKASPEMPDAVR